MAIVKIANLDLVIDTPYTYLATDTASGSSSLTVANITGFAINQVIIIGDIGSQGSEIIKTHSATAPTGTTITLASNTASAHSASTPVKLIQYDQVEISTATTVTGSKSVLSTFNIWADNLSSNYIDNANSSGYYFGRFKNTISSTFSSYSSAIPVAGFSQTSARMIIDSSLREIGKNKSEALSDRFFFDQIDMCQIEVLRELKRWSWMQSFDYILGSLTTGQWRLALPTNIDDTNTTKSIYKVRMGGWYKFTWVDKEQFDSLLADVSYTTLSISIAVNDASITLTNSGDFGSTGTVQIGANTYTYTANNTTTGVLTLSVVSTTTNTSGEYVFKGATLGLPEYFTIYGGYIYTYPLVAPTYSGHNVYMDYYTILVQTTTDSQTIVVPDPALVQYYLQWKALKKLNNGEDTTASTAYRDMYLDRRKTLKNKEVKNRMFKMRPRYNNFAAQTAFNDDESRQIRDGNFPNTGF